MQKNADLKNLYYPFWVRAGGPSAREGRARARARARALSTPAFQGRTSESRLFCYVNLRSVSGKVVQFLEFGKCAKSKIDSFRFEKVMIKMSLPKGKSLKNLHHFLVFLPKSPLPGGGAVFALSHLLKF